MCQFSRVFYSWYRHFNIHRTPCVIPICLFTGGPLALFSIEYSCPAYMGDPFLPTPPPFPLTTARSRFFDRRDAFDGQNRMSVRRSSLSIDTSSHNRHPHQTTYSLFSPMTAQPELLRLTHVSDLPENSVNCAICGGPLSECAFDPESWNESEFPVHLPCDNRHVFGASCILIWFRDNSTCPVCRCEFHIDRQTGGPWETREERAHRIAGRLLPEVRIGS